MVICGEEDFADREEFGKSRKEYLAKFLELPNGIPDSDTFKKMFEKLNPSELSSCLTNWISIEKERRSVIVIDGKTICGNGSSQHKAYHVISAFVTENQITLGELTVEEKTNEIMAVPELIDLTSSRKSPLLSRQGESGGLGLPCFRGSADSHGKAAIAVMRL